MTTRKINGKSLQQKFALLLLFIQFSIQGYSQPKTLKLIDFSDLSPIAYAEVKNINTGKYYMTDVKGQVVLRSASRNVFRIHALGYIDIEVKLSKDTILKLKKSYDQLPAISLVKKDRKFVQIGNRSRKQKEGLGMMIGNNFSFQVGLLIENSDSLLLQSVSFFVNGSCEKGAMYRLRLYELDGDNPNESIDLLNTSMVLSLTCKRCWEEVLLPDALFTDKNILVALEWLPDALIVDTDNANGLSKINSLDFFVSRSYYSNQCNMYNKAIARSKDNGWTRYCPGLDSASANDKPLNLMINVKAQYLK